MPLPLIPTTVVGSYPQPETLIDRQTLLAGGVPRVRFEQMWKGSAAEREKLQDEATVAAIRDQEQAGIDIITDGEIRRESYSNLFANALEGIDADNPAVVTNRRGVASKLPRITGPIRRKAPVETDAAVFLRQHTDRKIKVTLPGAFTMAQQAHDEYYHDIEAVLAAYADAVNTECRDLEAAGADVIQIDEPWLRNDPVLARKYAVKTIDRSLAGLKATTTIHLCFGYAHAVGADKPNRYDYLPELAESSVQQISIEAAQAHLDLAVLREIKGKGIVLGVLDLALDRPDTPDEVASRLRRALDYVPADRLIAAPDCGMKYLTRDLAFAKLKALAEGAAMVRKEVG